MEASANGSSRESSDRSVVERKMPTPDAGRGNYRTPPLRELIQMAMETPHHAMKKPDMRPTHE